MLWHCKKKEKSAGVGHIGLLQNTKHYGTYEISSCEIESEWSRYESKEGVVDEE